MVWLVVAVPTFRCVVQRAGAAMLVASAMQPWAAHAQSADAGRTQIRIERAGQPAEPVVASVKLMLPKAVLKRKRGDVYSFEPGPKRTLVVNPVAGDWFSYVERRDGYTITIEGDVHLLVTGPNCQREGRAQVRTISPGKSAALMMSQSSGVYKELLFVEACVPYRVVVECRKPGSACEAHKKSIDAAFVGELVSPQALDITKNDWSQRFEQPKAKIEESAARPSGSDTEFKYLPPGLTYVRQYALPAECKDIVKGATFYVDRRTRFSGLVFAGPGLMKRFPLALTEDQQAFANSQIFGPNGTYLVTKKGAGKKPSCELKFEQPQTMGTFDQEGLRDDRNFLPPWADTFCEWRGEKYTQPFCDTNRTGARPYRHYGVDIRGWDVAAKIPVVAVADGVVTELGREGKWVGFVVKVRSGDVVFAYRHLDPESSPFTSVGGSKPQLRLGDRVLAGQRIGTMGRYLNGLEGTTRHLHFEIEAPVPKAVHESASCLVKIESKLRSDQKQKSAPKGENVCTAREKAPPYPSLVVAYLRERYGIVVPLAGKDNDTGRQSLSEMPSHEIKPDPALNIVLDE
jgi:murein DD-endopeptidase MepM/ murein hydrolase activator NlpD